MTYAGDKTDVTALVKYAQDLEAEIERLRAALEPLADLGSIADNWPNVDSLWACIEVACIRRAQAALGDETHVPVTDENKP